MRGCSRSGVRRLLRKGHTVADAGNSRRRFTRLGAGPALENPATGRPEGKSVFAAPKGELPLGLSVGHAMRAVRRPSFKKPISLAHPPSACSGVKALRNTSAAKRQAAKLR